MDVQCIEKLYCTWNVNVKSFFATYYKFHIVRNVRHISYCLFEHSHILTLSKYNKTFQRYAYFAMLNQSILLVAKKSFLKLNYQFCGLTINESTFKLFLLQN